MAVPTQEELERTRKNMDAVNRAAETTDPNEVIEADNGRRLKPWIAIEALGEAQVAEATEQADRAEASADLALSSRDAVLLSRGFWPTTAAGIGQGVSGIVPGSLVGGSGGTNGTHALAFSGGTQVIAPKGRFVVAGGAVTAVYLDYAGYYSAGTPTLDFSASAGLTGASATALMGPNTPVGAFFGVPGSDPKDYSILYRNVAGVATEQGRYPSIEALAGIVNAVVSLETEFDEQGQLAFTSEGATIIPLFTDQTGRMILWFDVAQKRIFGAGVNDPKALADQFPGLQGYVGTGPIIPLFTDQAGRVILGFDTQAQKIIGAGLGDSVSLPAAAINHFLFYGQSLAIGGTSGGASAPISGNTIYSNLTFEGGPRASPAAGGFNSLVPLHEVDAAVSPDFDARTDRGETPCSGAVNYASTLLAREHGVLPADHVILASTAGVGGRTIQELSKGDTSPGGGFYPRLVMHMANAHALNSGCLVRVIGWVQGEADAQAHLITKDQYLALLERLQKDAEADANDISGKAAPVYMISYQLTREVAVYPAVSLAQLEACQRNPRFRLATPCYHFPNVDGTHLSQLGYKWLGAYFGKAYAQLMADELLSKTFPAYKPKPSWLNPVSATRRGAVIRVRFDVPVLPMVLDTATLAVTTDHGFRVTDGGSPVTISSIAISPAGDEVVITLAAPPAGATVVRYAMDYLGTGVTFTDGASGNLRDSDPRVINISGADRPLYNVAPHFQLPVTLLGE